MFLASMYVEENPRKHQRVICCQGHPTFIIELPFVFGLSRDEMMES